MAFTYSDICYTGPIQSFQKYFPDLVDLINQDYLQIEVLNHGVITIHTYIQHADCHSHDWSQYINLSRSLECQDLKLFKIVIPLSNCNFLRIIFNYNGSLNEYCSKIFWCKPFTSGIDLYSMQDVKLLHYLLFYYFIVVLFFSIERYLNSRYNSIIF